MDGISGNALFINTTSCLHNDSFCSFDVHLTYTNLHLTFTNNLHLTVKVVEESVTLRGGLSAPSHNVVEQ